MFMTFLTSKGNKSPKWIWNEGEEFHIKLYKLLKDRDFQLPILNREKWSRWPYEIPTREEMLKLKEKYPQMETSILSEEQENRMLQRFEGLLIEMGMETSIEGRNRFMNKLLESGRRGKTQVKNLLLKLKTHDFLNLIKFTTVRDIGAGWARAHPLFCQIFVE